MCDDEYECVYQDEDKFGITYTFDLSMLCATQSAYAINDTSGHTFTFNICGNTEFQCNPPWNEVYSSGVAVQYWGEKPACNTSAPECTDYFGNPICCSQPCEVLGVGPPQWALKVPANAETGGVLVSYRGLPNK